MGLSPAPGAGDTLRSCSKLVVENTSKIETHECFGGEEERRKCGGFFLNASWCLVFHGRGGGGREKVGSPMGEEEEDGKLLRKPLDFLA